MKTKFYFLLATSVTGVFFAQARTLNQAVTSGANWSTASAWSLGRIPATNDSIVIPSSTTIWLDINSTMNNVYVTIAGTLEVDTHSGLVLDNASTVAILSGGTLTTTHASGSNVISIGGTNKYVGSSDPTIAGPAMANSATGTAPAGFTAIVLPVTFVSFSAVRDGGAVRLDWITVNETENSHFEVERSGDGADWTSIGTVAAGVSGSEDTYSYADEGAGAQDIWYRLRQVDRDGHSMYSQIVFASGMTTAAVTGKPSIFAAGKTVNIRFSQPVTGRITASLVSMGGQVLEQQAVESASSNISLSASHLPGGIYVVYVTDGKGWASAQKVVL